MGDPGVDLRIIDFVVDYHAVINFAERIITLKINGQCTKIGFIDIKKSTNMLGGRGESSSEDQFRSFGLVPDVPRTLLLLVTDPGQYPTEPIVTVNEDALVKNEKEGTSVSEKNKEQLTEGEVDILFPRRVSDRDEYVEFASRYDDACRNLHDNDLCVLAKYKEVRVVDDCSATEHKMNANWRKDMNVAANNRTLCSTTTSSKNDAVDIEHTQQGVDTRQIMTDDRMITAEQLRNKINENTSKNLSPEEDLYNVLIKYQQHLTKRPRKCTKFEYEFKMEGTGRQKKRELLKNPKKLKKS